MKNTAGEFHLVLLFDLERDPESRTDVSASHSDEVTRLAATAAMLGLSRTGTYVLPEVPPQSGLTPARAVLVLLLTLAMCALSGFLALRKVRRLDPAEVF